MRTFLLVFGIIFLLLVSGCTPATTGTTTASPIKVAFAEDVLETESVSVTAGKALYVQIEQPSGFFDLNESKLNQLDKRLEIPIEASEDEVIVATTSSWFTLVNYQLFYNNNGELVLVNDKDWNIELKKTIARREIERVNQKRLGYDRINIRYTEWFDFVFAVIPNSQAGGEYFVAATIKVEGGNESREVVLRFKAPSSRVPQNLPTESMSGLVS